GLMRSMVDPAMQRRDSGAYRSPWDRHDLGDRPGAVVGKSNRGAVDVYCERWQGINPRRFLDPRVLADAFAPWKPRVWDEMPAALPGALFAAGPRLSRPTNAHPHMAGNAGSPESRLSGT